MTLHQHKPSTSVEVFPAVMAVQQSVEGGPDWDIAENDDKLYFYILRAAQNMGRFEPFTPDEIALNSFLTDRRAGKRLCDYAWRIFTSTRSA